MTVWQILYVSSATCLLSDTQLHELRQQSRRNNERYDVTGLLLYVDRVFLQVIEGPRLAIDRLFDNIQRDDRNCAVVKTLDRAIEGRAFPVWSMGFRSNATSPEDADSTFHNIRSRNDLDAIGCLDDSVFSLVRGMYLSNAGRSF